MYIKPILNTETMPEASNFKLWEIAAPASIYLKHPDLIVDEFIIDNFYSTVAVPSITSLPTESFDKLAIGQKIFIPAFDEDTFTETGLAFRTIISKNSGNNGIAVSPVFGDQSWGVEDDDNPVVPFTAFIIDTSWFSFIGKGSSAYGAGGNSAGSLAYTEPIITLTQITSEKELVFLIQDATNMWNGKVFLMTDLKTSVRVTT